MQAQPQGATSAGAQLSYDTTLGAGASWLPAPDVYDSTKPANPVTYSEDEKQDQRQAGGPQAVAMHACVLHEPQKGKSVSTCSPSMLYCPRANVACHSA